MDLAGEIWNGFAVFVYLWGQYPIGYGQLTMEHQLFLNFLFLFHCVPLYICRLCINFQDLCASLLGDTALRILLLTFISLFVIDFLSI